MEIMRSKPEDRAAYNYWLDAKVEGHEKPFKACLDTGAFITVVPKYIITNNETLLYTRPVLIEMADGKITRRHPRKATIVIDGVSFTPERGVLLRESKYGLIGRDIIDHMDVLICGGIMLIEFH